MRLFLLSVFVTISVSTYSNNISVSNIQMLNRNSVEKYVYISFDISWENSWRVNTAPSNWDATWVFVKFRANNGLWQHATLSPMDNEHNVPSIATFDVSNDGKGAFIFRSDNGSGDFTVTGVQARWLYGLDGVADDEPTLEIKVFGVEMVYIPTGGFYVGDGSSDGRLWDNSQNMSAPAMITDGEVVVRCETTNYDDATLTNVGVIIDGDEGISTDDNLVINNPLYPTGYGAFYCMKHEISNEQYVQFLNTLTREQQESRTLRSIAGNSVTLPFPMSPSGQIYCRNSVRYSIPSGDASEPAYFVCDLNNNGVGNEPDDGQNVALSLLGWADGAAYADWAGLRPLTELEFEKACRGPEIPIPDDYAWHGANITGTETESYIFNNLNEPSEYPQNVGTGVDGNAAYMYTTGHVDVVNPNRLDGPVRVGMFATASSDRINSGASYYGVLDLTGNMAERCVTLGKQEGRNFQGSHGDGELTSSPNMAGNATNSDWPGISATEPSDGVKIRIGSGSRGGDWNDATGSIRVSRRAIAAEDPHWTEYISHGNPGSGFRCARTVD